MTRPALPRTRPSTDTVAAGYVLACTLGVAFALILSGHVGLAAKGERKHEAMGAALVLTSAWSEDSGYPTDLAAARAVVGDTLGDTTLRSYTLTEHGFEFCLVDGSDRSVTFHRNEVDRVVDYGFDYGSADDCTVVTS